MRCNNWYLLHGSSILYWDSKFLKRCMHINSISLASINLILGSGTIPLFWFDVNHWIFTLVVELVKVFRLRFWFLVVSGRYCTFFSFKIWIEDVMVFKQASDCMYFFMTCCGRWLLGVIVLRISHKIWTYGKLQNHSEIWGWGGRVVIQYVTTVLH